MDGECGVDTWARRLLRRPHSSNRRPQPGARSPLQLQGAPPPAPSLLGGRLASPRKRARGMRARKFAQKTSVALPPVIPAQMPSGQASMRTLRGDEISMWLIALPSVRGANMPGGGAALCSRLELLRSASPVPRPLPARMFTKASAIVLALVSPLAARAMASRSALGDGCSAPGCVRTTYAPLPSALSRCDRPAPQGLFRVGGREGERASEPE